MIAQPGGGFCTHHIHNNAYSGHEEEQRAESGGEEQMRGVDGLRRKHLSSSLGKDGPEGLDIVTCPDASLSHTVLP